MRDANHINTPKVARHKRTTTPRVIGPDSRNPAIRLQRVRPKPTSEMITKALALVIVLAMIALTLSLPGKSDTSHSVNVFTTTVIAAVVAAVTAMMMSWLLSIT